ncbi:ATP-binding protein [Kitasatospora sp. NPDC002965]|uniref:ATP-binding protein n=1 Tax=Kitasatospora sp. NPDC002965 TaxID=3154775 RepID=UPI0033B4463B
MHTIRFGLPVVPESAGVARRWVLDAARLLGAVLSLDEADSVELMTSELVTNVVSHAPGTAEVLVEVFVPAGVLRVAVTDRCDRAPQVRQADGTEVGGRGLAIVSELATRHGWDPLLDRGKVVWFELRPDVQETAATAAATMTSTGHLVEARPIGGRRSDPLPVTVQTRAGRVRARARQVVAA